MTHFGSGNWSRRAVIAGLLASSAGPVLANAPDRSLRPRLRGDDLLISTAPGSETLIRKAGLSGKIAYAVADAQTGALLEGRNANIGLPPASVAKALTSLYALAVLGQDHRFITRVVATGGVADGIVAGDLVLVGGCDPTLNTNALADLAAGLKKAGIREVRGDFLVQDSAFPRVWTIDPDQPDHVGYSPAISGIALNFNRVHFEWKAAKGSYNVSMDARSDRYRPDVRMARMRVEARKAPIYTYRDAGTFDDWTVARSALGKGGARWLPVRRPGLYAGEVFATLARSQGIVLKTPKLADAPVTGEVVAAYSSDVLRTILQAMLRFSTNVTAEMVGLAATVKRRGKATSLADSAAEMNAWAREELGMEAPGLVDHSGLSGDSRLRPDDLVRGLVAVHQNAALRPLLKPVAMRDGKGRPLKTHPLKVDAKTGTLNFVSGLGGYMTAPDGRVLAFAIFASDEERRAKIPRAYRERPDGARSWNRRAKRLQQALLERWGKVYGS